MEKKKIIIIGAGISGLCAGCYLQMNGYDTEIFELHNTPGGVCTSWKRKGYTFDGCIHWLVGSSPADRFYKLWKELIDIQKLEFVDFDEYLRFVDKDDHVLSLFTNVDKLEKELKEKAPEDTAFIDNFVKALKKLKKFEMPIEKAPEVMNILDKIKMFFKIIPFIGLFSKYGKKSVWDLGEMCRNPLLKLSFTYNPLFKEFAALGLMFALAWSSKKAAGYPIGGSLNFARLFEKKYLDSGGQIKYKSKVTKVTVENHKAKGIVLENGETFNADIVISAADGYYTIYKMLEGKYLNKKINSYYETPDSVLKSFPSLIFISLGLSRSFDKEPHASIFQLEKPIVIDDSIEHDCINTLIYNFDPTLAEKGKTCINIMFETFNHEYWVNLRNNNIKKYREEKERIANQVIEALENKIGDIKSNVEVIDVATPATFIRYTNNWKGSFEGWLPTPKSLTYKMEKVLPGLDNFFIIGQWVEPGGGLPSAIQSGRNVTQIICKTDGKRFKGIPT